MNEIEGSRSILRANVPAILVGFFVSLIVLCTYVIVEGAFVRPQRERAQLARQNERVQQATAGQVGQDEFWRATVWDVPSRTRQVLVLTLLCMPASLGGWVAGWMSRHRPVRAAGWVVVAYLVIVIAPLLSDDNLPYPLSEVVTVPGWLVLLVLACTFLMAPVGGVALIQRWRQRALGV
jgi:hypothetical protein